MDIKLVVCCNKSAPPIQKEESFSAKKNAGEHAKQTIQIRAQTNLERVAFFSKRADFRFPKYFSMPPMARTFSGVSND
jgi:hypothetical protein